MTRITEDELKQLPRRALVAFAARCARRVFPVFLKWELSPTYANDVEAAFKMAEAFAAGEVEIDSHTARSATDTAEKARTAAHEDRKTRSYLVALAAFGAAGAAVGAAKTVARIAENNFYGATYGAANSAEDAKLADSNYDPRVDFDRLLAASKREGWTDETPVPLSFFEGESITGRVEATEVGNDTFSAVGNIESDIQPLEFLIDPGTATPEEIAKLFTELSVLYRMLGGDCDLEFRVEDCREPAVELLP